MPDVNNILNSKALDTKIDDRARKVFLTSMTNIQSIARPFTFLVFVLVGFIFIKLDKSVTTLNTSLVLFSVELKEVKNQVTLNKEAIVRLIDQQLASDYKE